uniref:MADF domain-containing protein n=1 Tax=Rhodnius prolixus TaxID=13249 RepID=T1ICC7_RHOPR
MPSTLARSQARRKWKSLRDTFRKVRRIIKDAAKKNKEYLNTWQYYEKLEFLKDQFEDEVTQGANDVLPQGGMHSSTGSITEVPETVSAPTAIESSPSETYEQLKEFLQIKPRQRLSSDTNHTIEGENVLEEQTETGNISQANFDIVTPGGKHFSREPIFESALSSPNNSQKAADCQQQSTSETSYNAHQPLGHHNVQQSMSATLNTNTSFLNLLNDPNYCEWECEWPPG